MFIDIALWAAPSAMSVTPIASASGVCGSSPSNATSARLSSRTGFCQKGRISIISRIVALNGAISGSNAQGNRPA